MSAPFAGHVALLEALLHRRQAIVDLIESRLLNVQGKDIARRRESEQIARLFNRYCHDSGNMPPDHLRLKDT